MGKLLKNSNMNKYFENIVFRDKWSEYCLLFTSFLNKFNKKKFFFKTPIYLNTPPSGENSVMSILFRNGLRFIIRRSIYMQLNTFWNIKCFWQWNPFWLLISSLWLNFNISNTNYRFTTGFAKIRSQRKILQCPRFQEFFSVNPVFIGRVRRGVAVVILLPHPLLCFTSLKFGTIYRYWC